MSSNNIKVEIKTELDVPVIQESDIWEAEDKAAAAMSCDEALKQFHAIVGSIKESIGEDSLSIDKAAVSVLMLKELNRRAHFRNKIVQDRVADAQKDLADKHLQLQNKRYEVLHLQKEIKKCLEFRSGDELIDLISMEEFLKTIPEEQQSQQSPHELQLNRLKFELEQRKALSHEYAQKVAEEKKLTDDITDLENSLSSLGPQLDALIEATKPVQEVLGRDYLSEFDQQRLSHILPEPLYSLYAQLHAYIRLEKSSRVKVTISGGDEKVVEEFVERHQQAVADEAFVDMEAVSASTSPEPDTLGAGENDDGTLAGPANGTKGTGPKRKKRHHGKAKEQSQSPSPVLPKPVLTCDPFPLDVTAEFSLGKSRLSITFWYYPEIHVVACWAAFKLDSNRLQHITAVDLVDGNNLLSGLYENDVGNACAAEVACALEKAGKSLEEIMNGKSCYKWANRLCGVDVPQGESAISYANTLDFVKRVLEGIKNREKLASELAGILGKSIPLGVHGGILSSFKLHTRESASALLSGAEEANTVVPTHCWIFEANFANAGTKVRSKESLLVFVPFSYPVWPPASRFVSVDGGALEAAERHLNIDLFRGGCQAGGILKMLNTAADCLYGRDNIHTGRDRKVV